MRRKRHEVPPGFEPALRRWYRRHQRPMPWRQTHDPYRIWLSEIMLQQTQVVTATPYYQRFLDRFPTLPDLARAHPDAVLAAWAGLGYYRRARHLHEAARVIVREHGARVPDDPVAFGRLPGVGRYTVGAVMSIAYGRPLPVLDGNVARVLSRVLAWRVAVRDPRGSRELWELAARWMPARDPSEWNQALMELGARVCTPRAPRCDTCPVRRQCRARALGRPEAYPPAVARRATRRVRRAIVLIERRGALLMVRLGGGLLDGLWEPPGAEREGREPARAALERELHRLGIRAALEPGQATLRHRITHRNIEVEVWRGTLEAALPRRATLRFVDPEAPRVALTALATRAAGLEQAAPITRRRAAGLASGAVARRGRVPTR